MVSVHAGLDVLENGVEKTARGEDVLTIGVYR